MNKEKEISKIFNKWIGNLNIMVFFLLFNQIWYKLPILINLFYDQKTIVKYTEIFNAGLGILLATFLLFLGFRKFYLSELYHIKNFFKSGRVIILITILFSIFSFFYKDFGIKFLDILVIGTCYLIILFPIYITTELIQSLFKKEKTGFLLLDNPIESDKNDELDYQVLAENFSECIRNNGDVNNLVFSIESGRGQGKTSFINLLKNTSIILDECLIFEFNPWHFDDDSDLLSKFFTEFKNTLKRDYYLPELSNHFDEILSILGTDISQKFLGFRIKNTQNKSLKDIKYNIHNSLKDINKKILIIIDDIDRIPLSKAKSLFKLINLCRDFHNTSYILCYDNDNFNSIDETLKISKDQEDNIIQQELIDNSNIREYLEKIVNVKYSLYPSINKIKSYFINIFIKKSGIIFSDSSKEGILAGIDRLFDNQNFEIYKKYISSPRGIKRLLNFFLVRNYGNREKMFNLFDQNNGGLYFDDYIKLAILNLYYDKLYYDILNDISLEKKKNTIFDNEGASKYKAKYDYENNKSKYSVNPELVEYLKKIKEKNIIKNIFTEGLSDNTNQIDVNSIYAGDNLDKYIKLFETITTVEFNKSISDNIGNYLSGKELLNKIMKYLNDKRGTKGIVQFLVTFEVIVGDKKKVNDNSKFEGIINYILDNFYTYSINSLAYCNDNIVKILNNSVGRNNLLQNCLYIGDYIYGRNNYLGKGIIERFFSINWGVKGLYNVLHFRHYIKAGNNYRNFQRGITGNEELNKPDHFYTKEISKYIYSQFKKSFINENRNVFKEIYELSEIDLQKDENVGVSFWGDTINKAGMMAYTIYQLTNSIDGVGCFNIDLGDGKLEGDLIKLELNDYYFNHCFDGDLGIELFINYIFGYLTIKEHFKEDTEINENIHFRYKNNGSDGGLLDVFEENKLKQFLTSKKDDIEKYINNKKVDVYVGFNGVRATYYHGRQIFLTVINQEEVTVVNTINT